MTRMIRMRKVRRSTISSGLDLRRGRFKNKYENDLGEYIRSAGPG